MIDEHEASVELFYILNKGSSCIIKHDINAIIHGSMTERGVVIASKTIHNNIEIYLLPIDQLCTPDLSQHYQVELGHTAHLLCTTHANQPLQSGEMLVYPMLNSAKRKIAWLEENHIADYTGRDNIDGWSWPIVKIRDEVIKTINNELGNIFAQH